MRSILSMLVVCAVAFSILTACQSAAAPPKPVETAKTNTNSNAAKVDDHGHADDAPRINLADAKKDFDAGNTIFVDTRAEVAYKQDHIKGAINVPAEAMELRYKEIPTGKKIIAYCS